MCSRSSPRAATSVATSTSLAPDAKWPSAAFARTLRHPAVQRSRAEALRLQVLRETVGTALRPHEDQRQSAVGGQLADERLRLAALLHRDEAVVGGGDEHAVVVFHLVLHRVVREACGEAPDLTVERGGEQHRLAIRAEHLEDALHVGQEPHVEHAVRLVEHADPHAVQAQQPACHQVEQAGRAWR